MGSQIGIEKRIVAAATVFVLALTGVIALSVRMFGIDLPNCIDVPPFSRGEVIELAPGRYEIRMVARMWKFDPAEIALPPGSVADIYISTPDVTHGVQILGTNFNLMAIPGVVNYARIRFDRPGTYHVVCNEYCGTAHHEMAGQIRIVEGAALPRPTPTPAVLSAHPGAALVEKYACTACHSTDGSETVAASFKGLYGTTRQIEGGTPTLADDSYLRESIQAPEAKIVQGYAPVMPPTDASPEEVAQIIDYIKSLK
jgi:cytochrome c oxidase subunit 2